MYRALAGDLEELRALLIAQRTVEFDCKLDRIDPPFFGFAPGAIVGVDPRVLKPSCDASERQTLPLGIHREGHRRARPQRRKQKIVGVGPSVRPSRSQWLVRRQPVRSDEDFVV